MAEPRLLERELVVLRLVAEGNGNAEIASILGCSAHTVKNTIHDLMVRVGLRNRAHATAYAIRNNLI